MRRRRVEEEEAVRLGSRFSGTGPGTLHAGPGKTASLSGTPETGWTVWVGGGEPWHPKFPF